VFLPEPIRARVREGRGSMRMRFLLTLLLAVGWTGAARALPVTLSLVPSDTTLLSGQTLSLDIVIGGLSELVGDDVEEIALEFFDLELDFDTTRLQFVSLSFGPSLGTVAQTFRTGPGTPNATGVVEMGNFSNLTEVQLLALQSAPFLLTTITFEALDNPGSAALELISLLEDSLGSVAGRNLGDELTAPSPLFVAILPEPGIGALAAAALALLGLRARARKA
jgi:hypothetical protein